MDYDIFISYRRLGGAQYARILKAELEKRGYEGRVFLDYDGLKDGKFDRRIMAAIDCARVFIFILSPGALDRCSDAGDWVRKEILYAIEHEKHIVPINFDGLFTGFPSRLPEKIRTALGQHQFSKIDSESLLDASMEKLIADRIAPLTAPQKTFARQGLGAEIMIISDADCAVKAFGREIGFAKADAPTPVRLKKGNYLLEFVSTENPQISERLKYGVPDNDTVDFIEIKIKEKVVASLTLRPYIKDGKWGYIDGNGNTVIPFIYDKAFAFSEGLANVFIYDEDGNVKIGFIDKRGEIVIQCKYNFVWSFSEGLALVSIYDDYDSIKLKYGYIDNSGEMVIPFIYDDAHSFSEGLACVAIDDEDSNRKYGFIDKSGEIKIPCIYEWVWDFCEGMASVEDDSGKWGFIDKTGETVIPFIFEDGCSFSEGLAPVAINDEDGNWKYGFIDKSGEIEIPCIYEWACFFREGMANVKDDSGKHGFIDKSGEVVIPFIFEIACSFSEGLALVQNEKDQWGYIDKKGQVVIPFKYVDAYPFENGLAKVKTSSGKWFYIDKKGNIVSQYINEWDYD